MACSSCKKKDLKEKIIKSGEFVNRGVVIFTIIWSVLGIYGLYSLISKFL